MLMKKIEKLHMLIDDYEYKCNDLIKKHDFNFNRLKEDLQKQELNHKNELNELTKELSVSNRKINELEAKMLENGSNFEKTHLKEAQIYEQKMDALKYEKKDLISLCERLKDVNSFFRFNFT